MPAVLWFRRDLRLDDNPALLAAVARSRADGDGRVVPLFVLDPVLWASAGPIRQAAMVASMRALDASLGGHLLIAHGAPVEVVPRVVAAAGARSVHCAADFGPYGQRRDAAVEAALALSDISLERTGSPYAVAPGRVVKGDQTPYRVFTPFYRAWLAHGWRAPADQCPSDVDWWMPIECDGHPTAPALVGTLLPTMGEQAALARWDSFRAHKVAEYGEHRNRADLDGTTLLSAALKWGEIHPRTMLSDLDDCDGAEVLRKELAWREFYADVLHHHPASVNTSLDSRFEQMVVDEGGAAEQRFTAWCEGRTGYPFVDAGMRQLLAEGWMHNRVRMVVASFLIKDLHLPWWRGARWFMSHLRDGDLASNTHGWQWTAGCGTDASPYYRVFNPVTQGLRFDPNGDYVRRYIPELHHLEGAAVHEPWAVIDGLTEGYPDRLVDHAHEREESLRRLAALPPRE
ncbi:MAG: deoxyribodipyrimidine photo-lyase [Actinobacteria bacterium]|nr:deoxyribodipyrimidine photo-lyase [Actinomycetota bacterium]